MPLIWTFVSIFFNRVRFVRKKVGKVSFKQQKKHHSQSESIKDCDVQTLSPPSSWIQHPLREHPPLMARSNASLFLVCIAFFFFFFLVWFGFNCGEIQHRAYHLNNWTCAVQQCQVHSGSHVCVWFPIRALIRPLPSAQMFEHVRKRHRVFFVYVGGESPLKV